MACITSSSSVKLTDALSEPLNLVFDTVGLVQVVCRHRCVLLRQSHVLDVLALRLFNPALCQDLSRRFPQ